MAGTGGPSREDARMAPRFRRRREDTADAADLDGPARLDDDEHAWWAQRDLADVWAPREPPPRRDAPDRDVLADHFGADWRTSFGFDAPAEVDGPHDDTSPATHPEATVEGGPAPVVDTSDPYAVLQVDPGATWDEIVRAHRDMARRHHPDRLFGQTEREVAGAEEWMRAINVAFAELRVRRGR